MDYEKLGLKVGLEFHQRLDTTKLFCECASDFEEEPDFEIVRRLRPTAGELGIVDPAAMQEFLRQRTFVYQVFPNSTDLVEMDEEPPHPVNSEAIDAVIEISLLLGADIVDEIHVMRKTVIDGSNTSGFQRTMLVAMDGFLDTPSGKVIIPGIYLEEESAGIVGSREGRAVYRLDRLGIPLVEIMTDIIRASPGEIRDIALRLGKLLRVTGKVKRGLGTIRQDVNISISKGARVEIKGLQNIRILDKCIEYEIQRQLKLLELEKEIKKRKVGKPTDVIDFTKYFSKTRGIIGKALQKKGGVFGIALKGYAGLLGFGLAPGRRFGSELADHAKAFGLGGIIHTDEDLSKYNIDREVRQIKKDHKYGADTALIFVAGDTAKARRALESMIKRLAVKGVPKETRAPLPDGNSCYMRPLPGASRLYPETDIPPVIVSTIHIDQLRKALPDDPDKILHQLTTEFKLSEELADKLVISPRAELFYELCRGGANPTLVATTLESTLRGLSREGVATEAFKNKHFIELFKAVGEKKIAKEAIPDVLRFWAPDVGQNIDIVLEREGFGAVSEQQLVDEARQIIRQKRGEFRDRRRGFNILMGELMKKYRGKADGKTIADVVNRELDRI